MWGTGGWRYYCNIKEVPVSEMKYRISKIISESKIWRFILNIEHDILARSNFSYFCYLYDKLHYAQAGCIVSDTKF